jgi:hypothetical protein
MELTFYSLKILDIKLNSFIYEDMNNINYNKYLIHLETFTLLVQKYLYTITN